jgi:hypothetical protein
MKYRIAGSDSITGTDRNLEVEAGSEKDAIRIANEQGVLPFKVSNVSGRTQSHAARKRNERSLPILLGSAGVLVIFLMCSGFFGSPNGPPSSPAPSYAPAKPYQYEESSDRDLKDRLSLEGYSESDKERIIAAAKKLDAAVKESERKRER